MAYALTLTDDDVRTMDFVGSRYGWTEHLPREAGEHTLPEHVVWAWREAADGDAEGGHRLFPMLNPHSDLYAKLMALHASVI